VVVAKDGRLLGARIAKDGQWRFPQPTTEERHPRLPDNYQKALLTYEDQWFFYHPGINPVSICRAAWWDITEGRIVSGGSTLTMQVARMYRANPHRTVWGKFVEALMAVKLEICKSKDEILVMYAANAPFGGNVVGLQAASWRYFQRDVDELSWAEAATLAILPNAPSQLYPGRNAQALCEKRNKLLQKLFDKGCIDQATLQLSLQEPLPDRPQPLPDLAPHLVERYQSTLSGEYCKTSISYDLQERGIAVAKGHQQRLTEQGINNLAALILDVKSGEPLLYIGNTPDDYVDIITSPRSSGSILKPFLYAAMLDDGEMMPKQLVADIPMNISGYSPKNFDLDYRGALPADEALYRSLNVPAVEMLQDYTPARFLEKLHRIGFTTFTKSSEHYGLSLILGGGEVCLDELGQAYADMARSLTVPEADSDKKATPFSRAACWFTFEALQKVNRPEERTGWQYYASSRRIAWKTGTSFGQRDAWAVGITPKYVVAVWAGNSNGEGRPGLTGTASAAPLLFDLFDLLPSDGKWFERPEDGITYENICMESGYKASPNCPHTIHQAVPASCAKAPVCPCHQIVHLSSDRLYQVTSACYPVEQMVHDSCFVLPPGAEWYYRRHHPEYRVLPPFLPGCTSDSYTVMEILYPKDFRHLYLPRDLNGETSAIVIAAAHRNMNTTIYWHLDDNYLGSTTSIHQMAVSPSPGQHRLTIVDSQGNRLERILTIVN